MKPIETITVHSKEGIIRPEKYRVMEEEETIVVRIDKIFTRSEDKSSGSRELIFGCQGVINGLMKNFELKYKSQNASGFYIGCNRNFPLFIEIYGNHSRR